MYSQRTFTCEILNVEVCQLIFTTIITKQIAQQDDLTQTPNTTNMNPKRYNNMPPHQQRRNTSYRPNDGQSQQNYNQPPNRGRPGPGFSQGRQQRGDP